MKALLYSYANEIDSETRNLLEQVKVSRHFLNEYSLSPTAFSPTGSKYLELVDARKAKWGKDTDVIRLYVKANLQVICITIRYTDDAIYKRYRAVLDMIRTNNLMATFPKIIVHHSTYGLYFTASDFKLQESAPEPSIYI